MIGPARRGRRRASAVSESAPEPRRLLLDTQVWLWWQADDRRLGVQTRQLIKRATEVHLSAAAVWEMAIKSALGKLKLPTDCDFHAELAASGFLELPVDIAHADAIRTLPLHHRDPFDRMLVVQARAEALTLVTADGVMKLYDVPIAWAGG